MTKKQPARDCIEGGKAPCPICPVIADCRYGRRIMGKSASTTRALSKYAGAGSVRRAKTKDQGT